MTTSLMNLTRIQVKMIGVRARKVRMRMEHKMMRARRRMLPRKKTRRRRRRRQDRIIFVNLKPNPGVENQGRLTR